MGRGGSAKQNFVQGAAIIAIAHITIKVIGALFKIPLERMILGVEGMGIYTSAYTIYNWLFMISTAGLPVAVSKMVAESSAVGNYAEAHKVFKISRLLLFIVGIIGGSVLFFGAKFFAGVLAFPSAEYTIMVMAPSLFFVALMSSYRGYFQGLNNMKPTAISEVTEAFGKLCIGLALAFFLNPRGIEFGAAGAMGGVTSGTALGAVFLTGYYLINKKKLGAAQAVRQETMPVRSSRAILKRLVLIAIPITLGVSVFTLTSLIDATLVMNQLKWLGYAEDQRRSMNGYLNHAVTMFNVAPTIISALAVSIVPSIAASLSAGNLAQAKDNTKSALRITILAGFPCATVLSVLAVPILKFVYNNTGHSLLLNIMGLAVALVTLVQVGNAILQANGKVWTPVANMAIGGFVKILVNLILIPTIHKYGAAYNLQPIDGAPIGTFLCYFTVMALNLKNIKKVAGIKYEFSDFVFKPGLSAVLMGAVGYLVYDVMVNLLTNHSGSIDNLSNIIALGISMIVAAVVYLLTIVLIGGLKREDMLLMPKGRIIVEILGKFKLIR